MLLKFVLQDPATAQNPYKSSIDDVQRTVVLPQNLPFHYLEFLHFECSKTSLTQTKTTTTKTVTCAHTLTFLS